MTVMDGKAPHLEGHVNVDRRNVSTSTTFWSSIAAYRLGRLSRAWVAYPSIRACDSIEATGLETYIAASSGQLSLTVVQTIALRVLLAVTSIFIPTSFSYVLFLRYIRLAASRAM